MTNYLYFQILQNVLKLINFHFHLSVLHSLGKIKNKGDFKGSHKKTDRAFKNSTAGQWITQF